MPTDIYARLRDLAAKTDARPDEMRPILLRVTTDLFALHPVHTPEEIRLFEEMASKLIDSADDATLALVARKLADCADAPASLLQRLRARGGDAGREILKCDRNIEWRELRAIAASGRCEQASAVASRTDLDHEIVRILAGRREREITRALAANAFAPLAAEDLRLLAAQGRDDEQLAKALLRRGEIGFVHLPLYLWASAVERARLIFLLRQAHLPRIGAGDYAPALDDAVCLRLEADALRQKRSAFAVTLAEILDCDPLMARKIIEDESGDALALAFVAIGLPREIAARIFLIAFPKVALARENFVRALKLFTSVTQQEAQRIIAAVTGRQQRPAGPPQRRRGPLYGFSAQDERPQAAKPEDKDQSEAS